MRTCISASQRARSVREFPQFEKHKLFLYKEDFAHFTEGLQDVIDFVQQQLGTIEERQEWHPEDNTESEPVAEAESVEENKDAEKKKSLFGFLKK